MAYPTTSPTVTALCEPRWVGWKPYRPDPCAGCPLYDPCVNKCPTVPGVEAYVKWIEGRNAAAEALGERTQ